MTIVIPIEIERELTIIFQILYAVFLGGFIGVDREKHAMPAGIRTYAMVCLGAALFSLIGNELSDPVAQGRIIANIVTGIGFLGAGIIFRSNKGKTSGLTTASTIWVTAAVGIAVGCQLYLIATISTIVIWFALTLHHYNWFNNWVNNMREKHKNCNDSKEQD